MAIRSSQHVAFGEAIRSARQRQGVSQEGLALKCGLDRTYVSGIERGERNPSLTNILRIAAALELAPAELLAGVDGLRSPPPAAPSAASRASRRRPRRARPGA